MNIYETTQGKAFAKDPGFAKPAIGDVVSVEAVDWGIFGEQYPANTTFSIVRGTIYGKVVICDDEQIALAFQVFSDGGVRYVLSIPFCTVERVTILERGE